MEVETFQYIKAVFKHKKFSNIRKISILWVCQYRLRYAVVTSKSENLSVDND